MQKTLTGGFGMHSPNKLGPRLRSVVLIAAALVFASAGVAFASHAIGGASYSGTYKGRPTEGISFKVSANGNKVTHLTVDTPFHCNGGCGSVASGGPGSARISSTGTFKVTLQLYFPPGSHSSEGTDTVTGKFLASGRAKGKVSSHFNRGSAGEAVSWTASPTS
jgi:hypothetical protein